MSREILYYNFYAVFFYFVLFKVEAELYANICMHKHKAKGTIGKRKEALRSKFLDNCERML